jgi:hypothetical protein
MTKLRWNDSDNWIWSQQPAHEALVEDEAFSRVQALLAVPGRSQQGRKSRRTPRPYIFRGLLFCSICERRMQGSWNNGKPHYRCVFPREYAQVNHIDHPRSVIAQLNNRGMHNECHGRGSRDGRPRVPKATGSHQAFRPGDASRAYAAGRADAPHGGKSDGQQVHVPAGPGYEQARSVIAAVGRLPGTRLGCAARPAGDRRVLLRPGRVPADEDVRSLGKLTQPVIVDDVLPTA